MAFTVTIKSDGEEMDLRYGIKHIDVIKEVNRIPNAQITLLDGSIASQEFEVSNSPFFETGKEVEIILRYEGNPESEATIFKGLITKQSVSVTDFDSVLIVDLKDPSFLMTKGKKNFLFRDAKDSAAFSELISNHGLEEGTIDETAVDHPELIQFCSTDWDFMITRAEANGHIVSVDDGVVSVIKPDMSGSPTHNFEYGLDSIINFEITVNAGNQPEAVEAHSWDIANQELTEAETSDDLSLSQGQGNSSAAVLSPENPMLIDGINMAENELKTWADAKMVKTRLSQIRGRLSVPGRGNIKPLEIVEITGIGDRFNGSTLITGVRHQVSVNGWSTDIQFGLRDEWFSSIFNVTAPLAGGLLPAVNGLQVGVVDAFEEDPEGLYRLKVKIPALKGDDNIVWARQAILDAGNERGTFFRPEIGDEVVLGFFNDDPRHPVILGSMYNGVNAPPADPVAIDDENNTKGIITREGLKLLFNDSEKTLTIQTEDDNSIILNQDEPSISIIDSNGNEVVMNADGISMKTPGDFKIEADGNVEIKGAQVDVK